jgi:transposase
MPRFIQGQDRTQAALFPERLDDYVAEDNPVRVVDAFVDELNLTAPRFERVEPKATGRPGYEASTLLKLYIYGYLNRTPSSRRLELETRRNVEVMRLLHRLSPDHKTIAEFRKHNGKAIVGVCREFVGVCRRLSLLPRPEVAIDGSKFKAVNNRDKNFTAAKMQRRKEGIEGAITHYLAELDEADSVMGKDLRKTASLERIFTRATITADSSTLRYHNGHCANL